MLASPVRSMPRKRVSQELTSAEKWRVSGTSISDSHREDGVSCAIQRGELETSQDIGRRNENKWFGMS